METKEPTTENHLGGKHSASIRIWHWSTYVVMSGSLATVLLAKTLFNTRANIPVVQNALQKNNVSVSADQARAVSHEFNDAIWEWHTYIGYALAGLLLFRIIIEFFNPKEQKLIPMLKAAARHLKMPGSDKKEAKHYLLVKWMYILFYASLLIQACTGLFMAYSDDVPELKKIRSQVSQVHSFFMWVILGYVILHIGGVIIAELGKKHRGIISNMIHGGKQE